MMPLSQGTRNVARNPAWASQTTKGTGERDSRVNPDDPDETPPLVIGDGWPDTFDSPTGPTPRRRVINEWFYRQDSVIKDTINFGIPPWDGDIDTAQNGIKQVKGVVYRALVADTPPRVNPTTPGQTRWARIGGSSATPPQQRHRFTSSQTWQWPYDTDSVARAVVTLFAQSGAPTRNSGFDINVNRQFLSGGASDGTTLWFIAGNPPGAFAYTASTRARDTTRDISNIGVNVVGAVSDGTILWIVNDGSNTATAWTISTLTNTPTRNISLGDGQWSGGVTSDGTTLWFVDNEDDIAYAYTAATGARNMAFDISLGAGTWSGAVSDGETIWFVDNGNNDAVAYTAATRQRNSALDIDLATTAWSGGASDGTTIWFTDNTNQDVIAYAANSASARLVTDGDTYTTVGDSDSFVSQTLTGISDSQDFAFTIVGSGAFAEVFPQI